MDDTDLSSIVYRPSSIVAFTHQVGLPLRATVANWRTRPRREPGLDMVERILDQLSLVEQRADAQFGLQVHLIVEFAANTVFDVLAVLAHHDHRRLDCREHREEQVEQDEWVD